ncbi:hypothetical protein AB9K41_06390, partial [Cribrihabitans sp. XS_ASV171]
VFPSVAILFHVALFARVPADGLKAGGTGGEAVVSLEAADATVAEMVAAWERPVVSPSVAEPALAQVEIDTETPILPRLKLAQAPRAEMRMAEMPPVETETFRLDVETALPRPRMAQSDIARPAAPSLPETSPLPGSALTRPDQNRRVTTLEQPQTEPLEIETETAEPPPSTVAPTASPRPPQRPEPRAHAEPRSPARQETSRQAEQTSPGRAQQRA